MECLQGSVMEGLTVVGQRFSDGSYFVPHLLLAADIAREALAQWPAASATDGAGPCVVLGTVAGDIHDIGKNIVSEVLAASGCQVIDLGVDQPPEAFVEAVHAHEADLVGLSAMMTTTFPSMERTVEALKVACPRVPVIVGGAPVTQEFADAIGADGYGEFATDALGLVANLTAAKT